MAYTLFDHCYAPDIHLDGIGENIVFLKLINSYINQIKSY